MKTKQQAIQEAYGEYWETVKDYVDENGFCHKRKKVAFDEMKKQIDMVSDHPNYLYPFRPKSLQGIENNRGWIRIESEDDLPKEDGLYITGFLSLDNVFTEHKFKHTPKQLRDGFWAKCVTHYQPYKKPKPPIY